MSQYQPANRHPLTLPLIVAAHGAVLTALALSTVEVPFGPKSKPTVVKNIQIPNDPPPEPKVEPRTSEQPSQVPSIPDTTTLPFPNPTWSAPPAPPVPPPPVPVPEVPVGDANVLPAPAPPIPEPAPTPLPPAPPPVRVEATQDPRISFQPPYPDSLQQRGEEGRAIVRVLIGPDGRVKQVEELSATHPAFMSATVRHARARWRFRPATVDGRPVESWKRMTVTFTLGE